MRDDLRGYMVSEVIKYVVCLPTVPSHPRYTADKADTRWVFKEQHADLFCSYNEADRWAQRWPEHYDAEPRAVEDTFGGYRLAP